MLPFSALAKNCSSRNKFRHLHKLLENSFEIFKMVKLIIVEMLEVDDYDDPKHLHINTNEW